MKPICPHCNVDMAYLDKPGRTYTTWYCNRCGHYIVTPKTEPA